MKLNEKSLEGYILSMRDSTGKLRKKPTQLWVYQPYLRSSLRILGFLKQPIKRVQGLRKRKRALYWRDFA